MTLNLRFTGALLAAALIHTAAAAQTAPAIPGVVAEGAQWSLAWQGSDTADGAVAGPDGGLLFAQEQTHRIIRLDPADDAASVYLFGTEGAGALSVDGEGRLYAVQRTCTDFGLQMPDCDIPTKVAILAPEPRVLADHFPDGRGLGRLNDLSADGKGGAYFTVGGAYHVSASGVVSTVVEGDGVRTNGVLLSPDGATLYVTNGASILAFDVAGDGGTSGQRDFARLDAGDSGDGMAADAEGRLYVTGVGLGTSVYVFSPEGGRLGVIPTPRQPVSIAFAGPDRRTLYLTAMGAVDADGGEHSEPDGERNAAMSVYRLPMLASGPTGRPK